MKLEKGDMFSCVKDTDHFIITTNATIKNDGRLVMGAGIAKTVRDRLRNSALDCGQAVESQGRNYGLILNVGKTKLGIFQVKYHWSDEALLSLIHYSAALLDSEALINPDKRFDLNFPGIGNGKLEYKHVLPYISFLPDNVHIWTFD